MNLTLPYLDTEEKLREFTRKTWHINIAPYHISAQVDRHGNVVIFPSSSYKMTHQQINCISLNHGSISVEQISFVHPCVLPVLEEAYHQKEKEDTLKQNALAEESRNCFKQLQEQKFNIAIARIEQENQRLQEELQYKIEAMQNYQPPSSQPSLLNRIRNFFKRNQK
jgi:septin family protein